MYAMIFNFLPFKTRLVDYQKAFVFQALRGGDRLIDVILRDPNMEILDSQIDQTEGSLEHETTVEG